MPEFPGYVSRQLLVEFCDKELGEITKSLNEIEGIFRTGGLNYRSAVSLGETYSINVGRQLAIKCVREWAEKHESPDIGARFYNAR